MSSAKFIPVSMYIRSVTPTVGHIPSMISSGNTRMFPRMNFTGNGTTHWSTLILSEVEYLAFYGNATLYPFSGELNNAGCVSG